MDVVDVREAYGGIGALVRVSPVLSRALVVVIMTAVLTLPVRQLSLHRANINMAITTTNQRTLLLFMQHKTGIVHFGPEGTEI